MRIRKLLATILVAEDLLGQLHHGRRGLILSSQCATFRFQNINYNERTIALPSLQGKQNQQIVPGSLGCPKANLWLLDDLTNVSIHHSPSQPFVCLVLIFSKLPDLHTSLAIVFQLQKFILPQKNVVWCLLLATREGIKTCMIFAYLLHCASKRPGSGN